MQGLITNRIGPASLAAGLIMMASAASAQEGAITCAAVSETEIAALFDTWNIAIVTRDPDQVAALYAEDAILLPTLSNQVRRTTAERRDYFVHFLEHGPVGTILERDIRLGCNSALDTGLYSFTFADDGSVAAARYSYTYALDEDGVWRIVSHHSSLMPEPVE